MSELDPMDARLHEYADRWRASSAPPPVVDTDRLPARSAKRAWWTAGVAAAAVAAGIAVGTTLVHHDRVAAPPKPAHTVRPGDVVPWAPLPATHPTIPTQTTPPSPDPAEAVGKPACRASDLRATARPGAAAGTFYLTVRLELVGDHPCRLEGYPDLEPLDRGRPVAIPLEHRTDSSVYQHPVLVAAGRPASVRLGWTSNWCAPPVHNDTIRMAAPGGGSLTFQGLGGSQCYGVPGSGSRSPILVSTFEPVRTRGGHVQTAYAGVEVSGNLELSATPGETVHFTVTLTSPTDLPLDPCPDYHLVQVADDGQHEETYALNCAAVPYRDARGRPYLPAGTPVQFEMRTTVVGPAGSTEKLSWALDTIDARGTGGTLTVSRGPAPTGPTTPLGPADQKTVQAAVATIQAFLDTWRRDGIAVASRDYSVSDQQAASGPQLSAGKVLDASVSSWDSPDHFTLEVSLDLHFTGDPMAWNQGANDRFVTVTRDAKGFRLSFATSP